MAASKTVDAGAWVELSDDSLMPFAKSKSVFFSKDCVRQFQTKVLLRNLWTENITIQVKREEDGIWSAPFHLYASDFRKQFRQCVEPPVKYYTRYYVRVSGIIGSDESN
jgi:hypothetical protein